MARARVWFKFVLVLLGIVFISPLFAAEVDFTMTVPNGWTQRTQSTALAQYRKGPANLIVTADIAPQNASTPDLYVAFVKEQLGKSFKKITFEPVVAGNSGGYDTRELKYIVETSGIQMKFDVLYVFKKSKVYTLTAAAMADFFSASIAGDVKTFFTSFKLK